MLGCIQQSRGNWDEGERLYRQSLELRTSPAGARIIASGIRDIQETIHDAETWERITGEFNP
ncbi:tetratricopeptide repeat protein [Laspinema olomoucense]|uniref:tetratricopeptide repeat protein n=1 Tax=Laspinema olomoucense TaxID=3231600 RepID=UPI0021BA6B8C|nr:tetratricopeptide repeat protein [Laspinema sp. D3d]MCT7971946.1 tetratricopeptide repeat-containing protein [Laspinema sp. D3d]